MTEDLFSPINYPEPKSQKDINNAVKKYPLLQRDFVWMGIRPEIRKEINQRWSKIKNFSESNFIAEFQEKDNFYPRLWELNLRYHFLPFLTREPKRGEPDLICNKFLVEAVVPAPTDIPDLKLDGKLYNFPSEEIARRVTSAFTAKNFQLKQRMTSDSQLISYSTTSYIIAIGLLERNYLSAFGMTGMSIVEEVMMGAGPIQVAIDTAANTATSSISRLSSITTRNQSQIEVAYFQREEYSEISGVLWSTDYLPKPKDLHLLLNPNAKQPLSPSDLDFIDIITYTRNEDGFTRDQPVK